MREVWTRLWRGEDGQDLSEYALILVLISLIAIAVLRVIGSSVHNLYSTANSNVTSAGS
jgi:Flp pilus assembly pilin Flp